VNNNAMKTRILYLSAVFLLLQVASAQMLPTPPAGWTAQAAKSGILVTSPGPDPRLELVLFPPRRPQGDTKQWFDQQTITIARAIGSPQEMSDVLEVNAILARRLTYKDQRVLLSGYPTPGGFSLAALIIPSPVAAQDPRIETAADYVDGLAGQKFELSAAPAAALPDSQPRGMVGNTTIRGDMDLTYHAKAIPSGEHDVPLKGTYLFVGSQFGASYGGVGTTMTWGQRPTAQLLLLFANGVAAKFDARGTNLAGRYQAEGFASLDVTNPSVVSGVPFGQWTEDGNAIQIRWNDGQAAVLAKNGQNLDGAGQHWTPFVLADGVNLEGTFVRKMEAGLQSQVLVLHKDGTFAGDGLNVTMGGSAVNPAFPARGNGRYQVRKGSMILYFANGFTQSIACTLTPPNSPQATVVLLNEFPFERVK